MKQLKPAPMWAKTLILTLIVTAIVQAWAYQRLSASKSPLLRETEEKASAFELQATQCQELAALQNKQLTDLFETVKTATAAASLCLEMDAGKK